MDGEAGEERAGKKAFVIDTNVIISAMLKETGYTRRILTLLTELYPTYTPEYAIKEIRKYADYLAEEKNLPREKQQALIKLITENINIIEERRYETYTPEAKTLTTDPGDIDFVALSLKLRETYREVVLLTWNTRDYKTGELGKRGITVLSPKDVLGAFLISMKRSPTYKHP